MFNASSDFLLAFLLRLRGSANIVRRKHPTCLALIVLWTVNLTPKKNPKKLCLGVSLVAAMLPTLTRHKQRRSPMGRGLLQQSGSAEEKSEDLAVQVVASSRL